MPDHEKVRFRRTEIASLERFPSAGAPPPRLLCRRRGWRGVFVAALALPLLLFAAAYLIGVEAIGKDRLRLEAERAVAGLTGEEVAVQLGALNMGLGGATLLKLEVQDARIERAGDATALANAGTLRFGLKALPLLGGRVELGRLELADAELSAAALVPAAEVAVRSPRQVSEAVFGAVGRAFAMIEGSGLTEIRLSNIAVRLTADAAAPELVIDTLDISASGARQIALQGTARFHGRAFSLDGEAERDTASGAAQALSVALSMPGGEGHGLARHLPGGLSLSMEGRRGDGQEEGWLALDVHVHDLRLGPEDNGLRIDEAAGRVAFAEDDEAFSVVASPVATGRTVLNFKGMVAPLADAEEPAYAFEVVSRDSVLAPADSPEPALPFAMRIGGRYEPALSRLAADDIALRTVDGEVTANAALSLAAGRAPGVALAVRVHDMQTGHVKQLWPWFAARGARSWTLNKVFGGRVRDGSLTLAVPPGRLGNGVPLSQEEVSGRFELVNTRFDIAGDMPPVRESAGWVSFRGTDVAVGLESGSVYLPSGRVVTARDGRLAIDAAAPPPRLGRLEIEVAGEAAAVAELAAFKPIDAARFHGFSPDDLSGTMSGHISADVPLQGGVPLADLRWRVALDYEDLSIARPVDGHEVRNAAGTLLVEPDRAEIRAEADLNTAPASLHIVQPLGRSPVVRERHITLHMDDATRDRLAPGLGAIVSGPFSATYEEEPDGRKRITVTLDEARLTVPWIGWQKGAGIPATAHFFMEEDDGAVVLSDFALSGESFSVEGGLRLSEGRLLEADLERVRFNREDDFAVSIRRSGGIYRVSVNGRSFDARPLIRKAMDDMTAPARPGAEAAPVALEASLAAVGGFGGARLEQVEISYASDGAGPDRLSLRAAAPGHGTFRLSKGVEGGQRVIRASTENAGAVLRFLDLYRHVEGGRLGLALAGSDVELSGRVDLRDFDVVDEPRLRSLVAASAEGAREGAAVDSTRIHFETGAAEIAKGPGGLAIRDGVLRGPLIGSTFQGTLYDAAGNTAITGTFMPLYRINRIFGEIPLLGLVLGNGRDRGLIGITYRLSGRASEPTLEMNPISAIAPGIFRQIFEYR